MRRDVTVVTAVILFAALQAVADEHRRGPGVDLIVVVDRSASMSGRGIDRLVRLVLDLAARNADATHIGHRFGMVSFGSSARVDLPPTPLLDGGAARARGALAAALHTPGMGHTDVLRGLTAARQLFDAVPAGADNRHVLLLITDGVAYVPSMPAAVVARELRRYAATLNDVTLEILLLPPAGGEGDERLWRDVSRDRVHVASADADVSLYRLVSGIVGTRTIEVRGRSGETLVVPPYLDTIVFDVFRGRPPGEVAIFAPDALRPIDPAAIGEVRTGELLSTVAVRRPAPGRWTFRKARADGTVRIFSQQFFPRGLLVEPAGAPVRQYDRVRIGYRISDGGGAPVEELPGYPLSVELTVISPKGERRPLRMRRDPLCDRGCFRAGSEVECDVAGRYWTEVEVKTNDGDERVVSVFSDRWSGFRVAAAERAAHPHMHFAQASAAAVAGDSIPRSVVIAIVVVASVFSFSMLRRRGGR